MLLKSIMPASVDLRNLRFITPIHKSPSGITSFTVPHPAMQNLNSCVKSAGDIANLKTDSFRWPIACSRTRSG